MIRIDIAPDKTQAWLSIIEEGTSFPSLDEITAAIESKNIVLGINKEVLQKIATEKTPVRKVLFAKGIAPVYSNDAKIDWKISLIKPSSDSEGGYERVDFKQSKISVSVIENQVLAVKSVAGRGTDGQSVFGDKIEAIGKNIPLPKGRNTRVSEDGLTLYSAINGSAFVENNLIHIDKIFHVKGNVSYATGNIKFDGPVVIEGDVLSGFRVEARDSIYIGGNVEAANVYSHQGDVKVQYGILGKSRAKILAGGNLECGFIQDATVGVRKDVVVDHYIINSTVTAGGKVEVTKNEGIIRGGNITAEKGMALKTAGSDRNIYTELCIRNHGENESQSALWELSRKEIRFESASRES